MESAVHNHPIDIAAVLAGDAALVAACEAHLEGRAFTWLERQS